MEAAVTAKAVESIETTGTVETAGDMVAVGEVVTMVVGARLSVAGLVSNVTVDTVVEDSSHLSGHVHQQCHDHDQQESLQCLHQRNLWV